MLLYKRKGETRGRSGGGSDMTSRGRGQQRWRSTVETIEMVYGCDVQCK